MLDCGVKLLVLDVIGVDIFVEDVVEMLGVDIFVEDVVDVLGGMVDCSCVSSEKESGFYCVVY